MTLIALHLIWESIPPTYEKLFDNMRGDAGGKFMFLNIESQARSGDLLECHNGKYSAWTYVFPGDTFRIGTLSTEKKGENIKTKWQRQVALQVAWEVLCAYVKMGKRAKD